MRLAITALCLLAVVTACARKTQVGSPSLATCAGNRILIVTNSGDEPVNVYASNGRTSTEIGTAPIGKKELTIPPTVRATSYFAVAMSRVAIGGSVMSAPTETRVIFQEECRPR